MDHLAYSFIRLRSLCSSAFHSNQTQLLCSPSSCSIKLYKDKGETPVKRTGHVNSEGHLVDSEGKSVEKLELTTIPDIKTAKYFETQGPCCWKLYKKKDHKEEGMVMDHSGSTDDLKQATDDETGELFKIKSFKWVSCKQG